MCLFEYWIAIVLVMPGKPSFRHLEFNVALRYIRYFCESSCLCYFSFNSDFYVSKIMHL